MDGRRREVPGSSTKFGATRERTPEANNVEEASDAKQACCAGCMGVGQSQGRNTTRTVAVVRGNKACRGAGWAIPRALQPEGAPLERAFGILLRALPPQSAN
jgi:hypothetical protein